MLVNGREIMLEERMSLAEYLRTAQYDLRRVAVEINGRIIKKAAYEQTFLSSSDKIEIVSFVGGG